MHQARSHRWLTRRRIAAALEAAVILGLPFITVGGRSALRFDIPTLKLLVFGAEVPISQFLSVLLVTLFSAVLFIGVTSILGRVWCGWLCPQSVLEEFSEDAATAISKRHGLLIKRIILIPVSALVSISMIWYFLPPKESIAAIAAGGVAAWFFGVQAIAVYAMLGIVGRRFCATVCPYSMLQSAFFDRDTMMVGFDPSRAADCMGCDACVRVCPMGIDIRRGLQRECIACARCADACETMTARRGLHSLVGYMGRPLRAKTAMWAAVAVVFLAATILTVGMRPHTEIALYRNAAQPAKGGVNTYTYTIRNDTSSALVFTVEPDPPFKAIGGGAVTVGPGERATGTLVIAPSVTGRAPSTVRVRFRAEGIDIAKEAGYL